MSKLIIVALICAVAYAQAGIITTTYNAGADCSGSGFQMNTTTNDCKANQGNSYAYFFDSANTYTVQWYGAGCNGTISSVTQTPIGCATQSYGTLISTSGTSEALPFGTFPPSGYQVSTSYFNTSAAGAKATVCSTGSGVVSIQTASNVAYCAPRSSNMYTTQPSSMQTACSADGSAAGSVVFSDATCETPAFASVSAISACTVTEGVAVASSCDGVNTLPDSLPESGFFEYDNADCSGTPQVAYSAGATCFDSHTLVCASVNGTETVTLTMSSPAAGAADGTCGGTVRQTQTATEGTCVLVPGSTTRSRKFFCTGGGAGGSASTASVSVVATLVAAVAAVFAIRSL